jgi:hypothetical protein
LLEEFAVAAVPAKGVLRAQFWYFRQVFSFIRAYGLIRLGALMLSTRPFWIVAVALSQYAVLFLLPAEANLLLLAALVFVVAARGLCRAEAGRACRSIAGWLLLFGIAAAYAGNAPLYTPIPLVAAFVIIVPAAGFQWAWRTGVLRGGSAVGFITGVAMFLIWAVLASMWHWLHPPFRVYVVPPAIAAIAGTVGAMFGSCFSNRREALLVGE